MEEIPYNIQQKIENLPTFSFDNAEALQQTILSNNFTEIFNFYKQNYLPDILKNKPEIQQRISLYLAITNQDQDFINQTDQVLYRRTCPDIHTFLTDKYYMGYSNATLYPYWREKLEQIFAENSPIRKTIFGGSIGVGKSTIARKAFIYAIYRVLCLRYPRAVFNVDSDATLMGMVISITLQQVYETNLLPFIKLLETMPCFQKVLSQRSFNNFDLDNEKCPIPYVVEKSSNTIQFPDNIIIGCGSGLTHTIGRNLFTTFLDEMNEKGVDDALELLNSVDNRFSSRFSGVDLVFQSIVSSARTTNSPIGEYIKRLPKDDPSILILTPKLWDIKQDPNFVGDGTTFPVMVGNGSIPSKIITDPGELKAIEDGKYIPPTGCELINVPTVYRSKFELQLDQSIQDIAGMTTSDNNSVFRDTTRLEDPLLTPEISLEVNLRDNCNILDMLLPYDLFEQDLNGKWQFKRAPKAQRYCFTGDTKVKLLNGTSKSFKELTDEYNKGIVNWVYTWTNEGWTIGKIAGVGKTGQADKLVKITLDNNKVITCTLNHKFMLRNGEYIEAKNLKPDLSLMPLYRRESQITKYKAKTYEQVLDNNSNKWLYTHKISANILKENYDNALESAKKNKTHIIRHHKDFNASNNNPDNLIFLDSLTHFLLHSKKGTDHFTKLWQNAAFREKMKSVNSKNGKINGHKDMMNKWYGENNIEWRKKLAPIQANNGRKAFTRFNKSEKHRKDASKLLSEERKNPEFNKKLMLGRIKKIVKYIIDHGNPITPEEWNKLSARNLATFIRLETALKYVDSFDDIKNILTNYNHKVKYVEFINLDKPVDVYNLTVEDKTNSHNFVLDADVVVSNCHCDLASGGNEGQCDASICILHKEWQYNEITRQKDTIYVVDLLLFINAKNKIDLHAIQNFLIDLVTEKNISIHTISSDQWNGEIFLQALEASGCFTEVKKVSVDNKLEPYMNYANLIEAGQVKIGKCPKLKKELEALILVKGKVTRTTELKDGADSSCGAIYNAQMNYNDTPIYEYKDKIEIKNNLYESMIDLNNEDLIDFI